MKKILITLISVAVAIVAMAAGSKLWVHSHSGNHLSIDIADLDSIGFTNDGSGIFNIKDVCGNTYKCVTIGSQVWMAENMRCYKYDTQSERAGATLSTSSSSTYAPYYTDGSNATTSFSGNLTSEQRSKLGYLYNWAAAVGIATAEDAEAQTSKFSTNRQGICPNGWHVPTSAEWNTLKDYLGSNAGKKLKSTSGWYNGGNGIDEYSFAALPAGNANGSSVVNVGSNAYFWSATPDNSGNAYRRNLIYDYGNLYSLYSNKYDAQSVRCVKNIPVQSVSLSKLSHNFQTIGESVQLTATVLPSDDSNPNVMWKSSDTSVATVSDKGLVTCTGFGSATITATADGKSATCNVSATKISVQSVTLSKTSYAFVTIGQTLQLTATVLPSNATYPNVTWESSNASVATVSDKGLVTCNGFGDATITATADGKSATCAVNATLVAVRTVTLSKTSYAFQAIGESVQLTATVLPANASYPNVTWETSNAAVATVSDNGLVTCKGFGDATITATADGKSSTCTISATPVSVLNVVLSNTSCEFHTIGETAQLTATVLPANATYPNVTWRSSDISVATVSDDGLVTCNDFGEAVITATADGKSATCNVSATPIPVQSVTLSKTSCLFTVIGETFQLTASVTPSDATYPNVSWKSSDSSVATVSDNGLITCTGFGKATITATADGKSATCEVDADKDFPIDICGNVYKYVEIGNQVWLAENMRCNKYDTQSERPGATLSTSSSSTYAPYYKDASNTYIWDSFKYSGGLSNEQIEKLGYLYNWAAAVGLASESAAQNQASNFSGNRQGVCPNGWHIPTEAEWDALKAYIEETDGKGGATAGKHLKTTSGWYSGDSDYKAGVDTYSFAALPAGYAYGSTVSNVGYNANFWTATPNSSYNAYYRSLSYFIDFLCGGSISKFYARSVRCVKDVPAQSISLSKTLQEFHEIGESVQLNATFVPSNTSYTIVTWSSSNTAVATVSNDGLVTCTGFGDASITATSDGVSAVCKISAIIESGSVSDVCGNTYKTVKIGTQWWMAENMRCNKYDTQSTRAGATLSTSSSSTYAPYYTDGRNATTSYSGNLTSEQRNKLGYLYNWAAAVGLASESAAQNQASNFSGNRQGICPNGWHVPTDAEWSTLANYVGSNAGKKLKATSGWYSGGNGTDDYFFAALPAGIANGSTVGSVGSIAIFWTATLDNSGIAYHRYLSNIGDGLYSDNYVEGNAQSVRCVKDVPAQSISLSKTSQEFHEIGESVQLNATFVPSNTSYTIVTWSSSNTAVATVSNDGLVTCTGFGDASITATSDGVSAVCKISAIIESGSVSDVCGNTYKTVKIGTQWWMAENMRCNKYDTQSTRAGATLSTSSSTTFDPYYIDASNTNNWASTGYSGDLSKEQIEKLGYLYNWAATVGLASESAAKNQTSSFSGNRQGICPNGWHVPTGEEWNTLVNYVGSEAGRKLKTSSGWRDDKNGTDVYGFSALPAGAVWGSYNTTSNTFIGGVGNWGFLWTSSTDAYSADNADLILIETSDSSGVSATHKGGALGVRCVRN